MIAKNKFITDILNGFQQNKGKGSFYCFTKEIIPELIASVIKSFLNKHPSDNILIVVDLYSTRVLIVDELIRRDIYRRNEFKIKILSKDYVHNQYHYPYSLTITVGLNEEYSTISKLASDSVFTMAILTENIMNNNFIHKVRSILPCIGTSISNNELRYANIYSPVEEHRIGVLLSDNDLEAYNKYTDYINTSISVFGDISNIEKCKKGDTKLGISATDFRDNLAKENGWSTEMDTTIPFIKQIDDMYNPNILYERACNFYTITKQRRDLLSDNDSKLNVILDLCRTNSSKRILIISKRGEYAAKVTKYLCDNGIKCKDYHDCIDDKVLLDNDGNAVLYKSGAKKGSPRIVGAQAQSTMAEDAYNSQIINVLSIKSSSNTKLKIACDMVIFTSPQCDNIIEVKKRFVHIKFNSIPTITHVLYCKDTVEQDKLAKEEENNNIKVIDETKDFIDYDENTGTIIW